MIKKQGIYGGTFDPVHSGHIGLALDALEQMELDEVIFVPAKIQPFKQSKRITDSKKRVEMLKLALNNPKFSISTWEIEQESVSYTYLTMEYFKKIADENTKIYFICGTDSLLNMKDWKESEKLIRENRIIVGSRPGYKEIELNQEINLLNELYDASVYKIKNEQIDISSSEIRETLKCLKKKDVILQNGKELVDEKVMEYIEKNKVYD